MIHLYAFVHGLRGLPEGLEEIELGGVSAVVGRVAEPLAPTTDNVLEHGRVVESLLDHADAVLPARLGEPFADAATLRQATAAQLSALQQRLLRVRGCVEFAVRIAPAGVDRSDGTSYLHDLARRDAALNAAHDALDAHALASRVERTGNLFRAAYLVRRNEAAEFADHAARVGTCTGPWAPYSFAGEAA